jgi:hypothetical protein
MKTVEVIGWNVGFQKVEFTKMLTPWQGKIE